MKIALIGIRGFNSPASRLSTDEKGEMMAEQVIQFRFEQEHIF